MDNKWEGHALEIIGDIVTFCFGFFLTAYMIAFFFSPWIHTSTPNVIVRSFAMAGGVAVVALGANRWRDDLNRRKNRWDVVLDSVLGACGIFIIAHNVLYFWFPNYSVGEPSLTIRVMELVMGVGIMVLSANRFVGDVDGQPPG